MYSSRGSTVRDSASSGRELDGTYQRDFRLMMEQKHQADRLVDTLTKRCDSLRVAVVNERKQAEERLGLLEDRIKRDQLEKDELYKKLAESHQTVEGLHKQLLAEQKRSDEYRRIAEAAIEETAAVLKELTQLRLNRG